MTIGYLIKKICLKILKKLDGIDYTQVLYDNAELEDRLEVLIADYSDVTEECPWSDMGQIKPKSQLHKIVLDESLLTPFENMNDGQVTTNLRRYELIDLERILRGEKL